MQFTIAPKKVKYYSAIKNEQTFDIHNIGGFRNYSYGSKSKFKSTQPIEISPILKT